MPQLKPLHWISIIFWLLQAISATLYTYQSVTLPSVLRLQQIRCTLLDEQTILSIQEPINENNITSSSSDIINKDGKKTFNIQIPKKKIKIKTKIKKLKSKLKKK